MQIEVTSACAKSCRVQLSMNGQINGELALDYQELGELSKQLFGNGYVISKKQLAENTKRTVVESKPASSGVVLTRGRDVRVSASN